MTPKDSKKHAKPVVKDPKSTVTLPKAMSYEELVALARENDPITLEIEVSEADLDASASEVVEESSG